MTKVTINH